MDFNMSYTFTSQIKNGICYLEIRDSKGRLLYAEESSSKPNKRKSTRTFDSLDEAYNEFYSFLS